MRVYENRLSALCDYFLSYFKEVLRMKSWEHPLLNSVGAEGKRHHMSDWLHLSLAHVCLRPILKQNLTKGLMLKRRYELIPNLVETAKAYMKHESETLEAVVKARNAAVSARENAAGPLAIVRTARDPACTGR